MKINVFLIYSKNNIYIPNRLFYHFRLLCGSVPQALTNDVNNLNEST